MDNSRPARILALDGGGIRGVFTAAFLAHLEQHLRIRWVEHLELLTGTSTGAILALSLAAGLTAQEALEAYKEASPLIFGNGRHRVGRLFATAHDNTPLVEWLKRMFQDKTLDSARVPVAIPTFDASTGSPQVWKGNHHQDLHAGGDKRMWEIALASAAAPTFLPAVQLEGRGAYLDGGLWANNPALVGLIEAQRYLGYETRALRLLSVGTGRKKKWLRYEDIRQRGQIGWAREVIELQFAAQSVAIHEQVKLLLPKGSYLRIDEELPHAIGLDDVREIDTLEHLGLKAGMVHLQEVKRMLGL